MQAPTHLVMGILVQKALKKLRHPLYYILVAFLCILFHGFLDKLTRFTYHPPAPLIEDWFWFSYHSIIAFLTLLIFLKYWREYKLSLIFSILPDLDWIILHSSSFFSVEIAFWKEPILHKFLFGFLDLLPPFSFLSSLPDWSLEKGGVITEFASLAMLATFIFTIGKRKLEKPALVVQERIYTKSSDKITSTWIDKLRIYLSCMDHEQRIRTSYQSLLTSLEAIVFSLVFTLYQLKLTNFLWLLPLAGIILCICFGIACEFRAENVDYWRIQIVKLVGGTDLEETFKGGKYRWIPLGKIGLWGEYFFGHWFERILVSAMLIVWQIPLWLFSTPFMIRLFSISAMFFWIIYAFHIIKPKGEIIIRE